MCFKAHAIEFQPNQLLHIFANAYDKVMTEISEMVITGSIIRHRGISVARAIWFVCSKLLKICFLDSRFVKEYLQGFSLSIKLAIRLQRFSTFLTFVFFEQ